MFPISITQQQLSKMKYFLITVLLVTLFVSCTISRGGGRGGGGGGRGGGWGSSRGGGRIGGGSRGGGYKGSKGYKGGRIKGGTLTKAAAIGAVAYTGYQVFVYCPFILYIDKLKVKHFLSAIFSTGIMKSN